MANSTVLSVRISAGTRAKLDALAASTRRSRSFLAAEAVEAYADRQLDYIRKVQEGLEDVRNGHTVPHDEAMARLEATIRRAEARRTADGKA